jgi:hypothetical protein
MENHGGMMLTEENSWYVHQSSLAILPAESSGSKQEEWAKGMMNLALQSIFVHTFKWFIICRKFLHGASGFTYPLKEGVLQIFISLKNPLPRPGLNLQTLGQMANMLTIT